MSDAVLQLLEAGYRYQTAGQLDRAEAQYRDALRLDPDNVHALNLLGVVCIGTDRADEAVRLISAAVAQNQGDAQAFVNLGLAHKQLRQWDKARSAFSAALRLEPGNPVTHNNLGNVLAARGDFAAALTSYRHALSVDTDYAECLSNLAHALKETGNLTGALAAADRAIELKPHFAAAHNNRGEVLFRQARFAHAADSYRQAVSAGNNFIAAKINLSAALKETGDIVAARTLLDDIIASDPDNPRAHNSLGVLLEQLGDAGQAAACFRHALRLAPDYGNAWYQLAQLQGQGLTDDEVAAVTALLEQPDLGDEQQMPLTFALACAFENRADHDQAFHYLARGQALKARRSPYDDVKLERYYDAIMRIGNVPQNGPMVCASTGGPLPVFVLGMPRSGTSLIEQILSSHPSIYGAGERSFMEDTIEEAKRLTGGKAFPHCLPQLTVKQRNALGEAYRQRLAAVSDGQAVVIDKTPMNFQYIGFIAGILPDARFIHCRRMPADNCLSIFRLPFEASHAYSHSLKSLGQYYRRYVTLMRHWSKLPGVCMAEARYEDTVADLEGQSRRLLDFIGLPFDDAVLSFHQTERIVKTPSASQVRQPIYAASVQRWKKYEQHLGPLLAQLERLRDD